MENRIRLEDKYNSDIYSSNLAYIYDEKTGHRGSLFFATGRSFGYIELNMRNIYKNDGTAFRVDLCDSIDEAERLANTIFRCIVQGIPESRLYERKEGE